MDEHKVDRQEIEEPVGHKMTDDDWTEYVLSLLDEDQLYKGYPKVDGLRRVLPKLGYNVMTSYVNVVQAPNESNNYTATVIYQIVYGLKEDKDGHNGHVYTNFSDVADACKNEFQAPFNKHISAIAATRAEGRTIRKLLRLKNILTYEEKDLDENIEEENKDRAGTQQLSVIKMMCKKRKLDLDKVANKICNKNFGDCGFVDCQNIVKELNLKNKSDYNLDKECGV
jgi:hypothetical protein